MEDKLKQEIIQYIYLNCETLTVEQLAENFGYSYFYFSRAFKKTFHVSAVEYIATVKIQKSIQNISPHKTILSSQLSSGYLSTGSFTNSFKKKTGLKPLEYRKQLHSLALLFNDTVNKNQQINGELISEARTDNNLEVEIILPALFKGIAFVGMFKNRVPNHVPIVGKAVTKSQKFTFKNIPNGKFYLMSCGIPKSKNILNYFFLKDEFRCCIQEPIFLPNKEKQYYQLKLREKIETDPPLTINLPHLLYGQIKQQK